MKILQVNCVYGKGSTGKIVQSLHQGLLEKGVDSVVYYGRGEVSNDPGAHKICGEKESNVYQIFTRLNGQIYSGCYLSTKKLIRAIQNEKPDIVHLQCINGFFTNIYKLVEWLKENHYKTVLTLHAEFMYTGTCGHSIDCEKWKTGCGDCPILQKEVHSIVDGTHKSWMKMKNAFDGFAENLKVISVSPWLMERAKSSPILGKFDHDTIFNGLNTDIFKRYETDIKSSLGIAGKMVFFAAPTFSVDKDHFKGGYFILQLAKKLPEISFVVAGNYDKALNLPKNIYPLGHVNDQAVLAQWYSCADVTVLTSKRETFSLVVAESLACGTPVVGFKAGAPEMIAIPEFSSFVNYGDQQALEIELREWLNTLIDRDMVAKKAESTYSVNYMVERYLQCYNRLLGE